MNNAVHIHTENDNKVVYIELVSEEQVKHVFARVARLAKDGKLGDNKVSNYFLSIVYKRKQAILQPIRAKKTTDTNHYYQIRMGLTGIKVHKKHKDPSNYYARIPLTAWYWCVPDQVSLMNG